MQDDDESCQPVLNLVRRDLPLVDAAFPVQARYIRILAVFLLFSLILVSVLLFVGTGRFLERIQTRFEVENTDSAKIRAYNEKLDALKERMTVFIADSVETRLRALENNVAVGTIGPQEIRTLEELKNELRLLEDYSAGKGGRLTDQSRLDHPRFRVTPGTRASPTGPDDLLGEVVKVKNLLYVSLFSCGFIAVMIGGCWWQSNIRIRRLDVGPGKTPLLPGQSRRV